MSTGGSSSAPTNQNVTQTNIPKEFLPYFSRLMGRVEEASLQPYQTYGGDRTVESSNYADITGARNIIRDTASGGLPSVGTARRTAEENINLARGIGNYGTGEFTEFNYGPARQFTSEEAQKYMSPYIQGVLDVQKSRAMEDFDRLRGSRNTRAVQAGAFGGSRQAVQEAMAEEGLRREMNELEATGRQRAFEQAAQLFGTDRAAEMQLARDRAAELERVQTGREASRQFGAGLGLDAIAAAGSEAGRLLSIDEKARETEIQNAQLLDKLGRDLMAEDQARLDIDFEDFLRQKGYSNEQLGLFSDILRGLPVANVGSTTEAVYTDPVQQTLGAGLTGLSLYKAFT